MAKRRKEKDEEEDKDFKIPKFDEESFLKRERRNIKTTFISFLFGILIALISFGFWSLLSGNALRWELVLLFGVFSAAWLKYIFLRLNVDVVSPFVSVRHDRVDNPFSLSGELGHSP